MQLNMSLSINRGGKLNKQAEVNNSATSFKLFWVVFFVWLVLVVFRFVFLKKEQATFGDRYLHTYSGLILVIYALTIWST